MEIHKRVLVTKILILFLIGILTKRVIFVLWLSWQNLGGNNSIKFVGLKELFIPFVAIVFFSILWKILRLEYILLVIGLSLIFGVLYESFFLPAQALAILHAIGLILFVVAVIRITIFLISKRSNNFFEESMKKWRGR